MTTKQLEPHNKERQWHFSVMLAGIALLFPVVCLHADREPTPSISDLIQALQDKDETVRVKAASTLEMRGRKAVSAVPNLLRALKDPQPKVRDAAARALSAIQGKKALIALVKALKAETDPDVRLLLVTIVRKWCRERGPEVEKIIPALIETLKLENEKYWEAVQESCVTLFIIGPKAVPALVELAKDKDQDPVARGSAVDVLGWMKEEAKKAIPALIELVQDPDEDFASRTAGWLPRIGAKGKDVVQALETMGEQNCSMTRCLAATRALAEIDPDNKHLVPFLLKIFKHGDRIVRFFAMGVARQLGPRARRTIPYLLHELNDAEKSNRRVAAYALGTVASANDKDVLTALQKACRDPSSSVRNRAFNALKEIEERK